MKLVVQRVKHASVTVDNKLVSKIENGFMVLIGITHSDTKETADYLASKLVNLRIFDDENDKINYSLKDVGGSLLIVSQFTLYANCEKGNRPSFVDAAMPDYASDLYDYFCDKCENLGFEAKRGIFGADMKVELLNDGPFTVILEK